MKFTIESELTWEICWPVRHSAKIRDHHVCRTKNRSKGQTLSHSCPVNKQPQRISMIKSHTSYKETSMTQVIRISQKRTYHLNESSPWFKIIICIESGGTVSSCIEWFIFCNLSCVSCQLRIPSIKWLLIDWLIDWISCSQRTNNAIFKRMITKKGNTHT